MDCRGRKKRRMIVENYKVEPVAHIKLLANQTKQSDAGPIIVDKYYIFSAIGKENGEKHIIQCGMGAARDFLQILKHPGLPLFNPLEIGEVTSSSNNNVTSNDKSANDWNDRARQLYNAIMWLIIAWDAKPNTPIFNLKKAVEKKKRYEPSDWNIKSVNTVIKNGGKGKTLTETINAFGKDNNIKDSMCDFKVLNERINKISDGKGGCLKSYF